ncbi:MAG: universal stress protein [Hyphomicrobiales bacterium]|nr:MAG: universal stress protein [Hyphomicrobiales bacterium]
MIKDIVVHLTGSPEDAVRLAYADAVAQTFSAHLTGLQVHVLPELLSYTDPSGSAFLRELIAHSDKEADEVTARLTENLAGLGPHTELRRLDVYPGEIGPALADQARVADLFVGTRPYGDPARSAHIEETVLFHSGRACVFLPPQVEFLAKFDTVLVGWKNAREAARAVAEAIPFLQRATTVVVVLVAEGGASLGSQAGADIGRYLSRHGVNAEIRTVGDAPLTGEALLREAAAARADLLVMGGYGHSRIRELVLGGATRDVLVSATLPVLMAH